MSVKVSKVRQSTRDIVLAGMTGWRESTVPWDLFGILDLEADNLIHKCFAVGVPETLPMPLDRQRDAEGLQAMTRVSLRWSYQVSAMDQLATFDEALDFEQTMIGLMSAAVDNGDGTAFQLIFESAKRVVEPDGWVLGDITSRGQHRLALQ